MNNVGLTPITFGIGVKKPHAPASAKDHFLSEHRLLDPLLLAHAIYEKDPKREVARIAWGKILKAFFDRPELKIVYEPALRKAAPKDPYMQQEIWANILDDFNVRLRSYRKNSEDMCHGTFFQWLRRVIHTEGLLIRRHEGSQQRRKKGAAQELAEAQKKAVNQHEGPQVGELASNELVGYLTRAITAHIDPEKGDRDPFLLFYEFAVQGKTYPELIAEHHLPEGTVKRKLNQAREVLQDEIPPNRIRLIAGDRFLDKLATKAQKKKHEAN